MASENPGLDEEELEFKAFVQLKLKAWAAKVPEATADQRSELINEWLNDKEVRARLNQQYRLTIRKKGYAENVGFKDTVDTLPADPTVLADGAQTPSI